MPPLDETITAIVVRHCPHPTGAIRLDQRLVDDLGLDSLALVRTVSAIETELDVELPAGRLHELRDGTLADACAIVAAALRAAR